MIFYYLFSVLSVFRFAQDYKGAMDDVDRRGKKVIGMFEKFVKYAMIK